MNNPLLSPSKLKNASVPFDQIRPEHFAPALESAIALGHTRLKEIKKREASFDNTLRGLESATEEIEYVFTLFSNLLSAHGNAELQKLSLEFGPKVASFANDILLDSEIFQRVEQVYQQRQSLALGAEQIQLVEKVYRDFQRSGAGLSDSQKIRLRAIDERMAQLNPMFRENVLKSTNAFALWLDDEKDLAGLPATHRTAAKEAAAEKGQPQRWLITLQHPSYIPFMTFADSRVLREKLWRASSSRALGGANDNQPVILETVSLAHEKAVLLGAKSYAEYSLQVSMAETPSQVLSFLERLRVASFPAAQREVADVQALANELGGPSPLQSWDFSYYAEKLKEKRYAFDDESLRPYFKLDNVLNGVFEHARRLFGLKFIESRDYPVYQEDVRVFEVYKNKTKASVDSSANDSEQTFVGLFYTDFFPRASKSQGAWMTNYYEQGVFRGQRIRPHVSIVCNFTKPSADQPSLLSFDEVTTLFHEFGHGLHSLLSQVEFRSLAGTNVYRDFVELPSQILENWAEEKESLQLFAHHYKTGELIPMELIDKLKRAQRFLAGYYSMRQLNFAFLDMAWFLNPPPSGQTVLQFEDKITERCQLLPKVEGVSISTAFAHIFGGGYSSSYYSYKWAEALDADAFELFRERGIFDQDSAHRLEEFILSKGGSEHPMRLYENFRGRAPDPEALLRRDGLLG